MNFDDIISSVKDVLADAAKGIDEEAQRGIDAFEQDVEIANERGKEVVPTNSTSYLITDNNTGDEKYVKVFREDESGNIIKVVETFNDGTSFSYVKPENIDNFFGDLSKKGRNLSIYSAPIDITKPSEIPDEYHNDRASVFYDTAVDGDFDANKVFGNNNHPVRWFGTRKSKLFKPVADTPYQSFEDALRQARLMGNTFYNVPNYYPDDYISPITGGFRMPDGTLS